MKVFDAIHGFIELDPLETKLIKTLPFKRLTCINQIASASYVYPGGYHKRFDHSLGVMQVVTKIYDKLVSAPHFFDIFPDFDEEKILYWRRVMRLAGLFHDIGHLPFSHTAELQLVGKKGHERWTMRILRSHFIKPYIEAAGIHVEDVVKVAVGEDLYGAIYTPWEKVVSEILTADYFGGDRIDYLLRDAYFTGLSYGNFDHHQLINNLTLLMHKGQIMLGLEENGLESCYAMLLSRYFMHKRLYQYERVKPYWFHSKEVVRNFFEGKDYLESVENYIQINDYDIFSEINKALFDPLHKSHDHAKALMDQKEPVHVFPVTSEEIEFLESIGENHFFEKNATQVEKVGLFFPVLLKTGMIVEAQDVAEVSIPVYTQNWVYADSESMYRIKQALNNVQKDSQDSLR
ncbi:MAG: HD domain-containing protein [Chlamydiae bacterium]|jgi:HD superfamily phosphohydrolase|nr:HD domain-containing protein [Chlamydiota bacterium]